ncbi:MAG TPA: FtsQ-type POTRA domain-containing protein [Candidatus Acidoferrales bacterium]|nr:FtsQ-type POTRA domain-containing protein [Candidatus Acidoferrales bacterium]
MDRPTHANTYRRAALYLVLWGSPLLLLAAGLALYAGAPRALRLIADVKNSFLNHAYFSVREIKVSSGERLGGSEIVAMAGLTHGMNLWRLDTGRMERAIARHPWVKRAQVRREFPHRVVIRVEERTAKALLFLGGFYYIDEDGHVFQQIKEGERADLPLLSGLDWEELGYHSTPEKIRAALRLSERLAERRLTVSEMQFTRAGLVVYLAAYPVALYAGWGDWEAKLAKLDRVLAEWRGKEAYLESLNLSFENQVVLRLRKNHHG